SESFDECEMNHQNQPEVQAEQEVAQVENNLYALDRMDPSTSTGRRSKAPLRKSAHVAKILISAAKSVHQSDRSTDHAEANVATRTQSKSGKRTANEQHGAGPSKMPK